MAVGTCEGVLLDKGGPNYSLRQSWPSRPTAPLTTQPWPGRIATSRTVYYRLGSAGLPMMLLLRRLELRSYDDETAVARARLAVEHLRRRRRGTGLPCPKE